MDNRKYNLGLFGTITLECGEDGKCYYYYFNNGKRFMIVCNIFDESMKLMKKQDDDTFVDFDNKMERHVIKDIVEDGNLWEGDWYNEKPFGFGSVYDGEGNRIYVGFMFDGKKIGYGTEFFSDNHKVDYCGNFINDKRHGWGVSYDRDGQKLYGGDWIYGMNYFDCKDSIVINWRLLELKVVFGMVLFVM